MPETSSGASEQSGSTDSGMVPNQLAILVPSFDPSKDDIDIWTKKIELLVHAWPEGKITELVTRTILSCSGSAFQKLQLHQSELLKNDRKVIPHLVSLLGGQWGSIPLEKRYECAERALYRCKQLEGESNDSFLAAADVMWAELLAKGLDLSQLQAYVVLRGSRLSAEDKKRVLVESGAEGGEALSIVKVSKAVRMLGAGFFEELTSGKKSNKQKVFDSNAFLADADDVDKITDDIFVAEESGREDEFLEALWTEGDEDASLVCEYEEAAADLIQSDPEMASCYNAYLDARRRLADRFRSRGFWPPSQKGRGKGFKGKGKGGGKMNQRKSLQSRILSSNCRLCGQRGHWKAECPFKDGRSSSTTSGDSASVSFTSAQAVDEHGLAAGLPLEFVNLPLITETPVDEARSHDEFVFVLEYTEPKHVLQVLRSRANVRMKVQTSNSQPFVDGFCENTRNDRPSSISEFQVRSRSSVKPLGGKINSPDLSETMFASHGSYGVADLGASKTVIGSDLVGSLIRNLHPTIRQKLYRCACNVQFRFGNQATLGSKEALVVPLSDQLHLKIAVVQGSTPFLLSNALLRTLQAVIDTGRNTMSSKLFQKEIPLKLTDRGLYLIDLNDLCQFACNDRPSNISQIDQCPWKISGQAGSHAPISTTCCTQEAVLEGQLEHSDHDITLKPLTNEANHSDSILNTQVTREGTSCDHVIGSDGLGSSFVTGAIQGGARTARSVTPHVDRSSGQGGRFRGQAQGGEVLQGMAGGSKLGDFHVHPIQQEPQSLTQAFLKVCGVEDRRTGEDRTTSPGDNTRLIDQSPGRAGHPGHASSPTASQDKGQEQGGRCQAIDSSNQHGGEDQLGGDLRHQRELERSGDAQRLDDCRCPSPSSPDASHGDGLAADCVPSDQAQRRPVSESETAMHATYAGDIDVEAMWNTHRPVKESITHPKERHRFWQLVHQLEKELEQAKDQVRCSQKSSDLFEIFCSSTSQLTHQAQQLGMQAQRFGKEQCDLQTPEGRAFLFKQLWKCRPRDLWYSPECGPWCSWSQLNCAISLELFDKIHHKRKENLYQIALGLVLFRHQYRSGKHFHWEQPQKSLMFKLPYLQQVLSYTWAAEFDMCEVGKLQDPQNHKLIKKGMEILTTSERMFSMLHGRFCRHDHEHQPIEGTTVLHTKPIARSRFTESYPRLFARQVVKCMKQVFPLEKPPLWEALVGVSAHERLTKRIRAQSRPNQRAADQSATDPIPKRLKLLHKQPDPKVVIQDKWQEVFSQVDKQTPRVGRIVHRSNSLTQQLQSLFDNKQIVCAIACRGTDRMIAPPSQLLSQEAPFRRMVFIHRVTGKIMMDEEWEEWGQLSNRQLIRSGHPAKLGITVFACNTPSTQEVSDSTEPISPGVSEKALEESRGREISCEVRESPSIPGNQLDTEAPRASLDVCDLQSQQHGPRFLQLSSEEKALILKAHRNLGHPSAERLSWMLKQQGYRPEIVQGVFDMKCSACSMHQQPRISRPSTIKDPLDFNDRISVDGLTYTAKDGHKYHIYHLIDYATSFHVACSAPNRSSSSAIQFLGQQWIAWAGAPVELVVDAATEFNSEEMEEFCNRFNICKSTICPEAHWQNSRSERHGGILEKMLEKYEIEFAITNQHDLQQALWHCCQAKNASSLRAGYSPEILVFGKATRVPGSITSDSQIPAHLLADSELSQGIRFREQLAKREAARKAFHAADNDSSLRRSLLRRTRPERGPYPKGSWVMMWRTVGRSGQWIGPLRVALHENSQVVWASMSGKLYRSAPENIRPITALESQIHKDVMSQPDTSPDISGLPEGVRTEGVHQEPPPTQQPEIPSHNDPPVPPQDPIGNQGEVLNGPPESASSEQPDFEPEVEIPDGIEVPIPEDVSDELNCVGLICVDAEDEVGSIPLTENQAFQFEILLTEEDISRWREETHPCEMAFLASTSKKQRSEVKVTELTPSQRAEFDQAKNSEIQNWLNTKTVAKLCRHQVSPKDIMRCRWILTWKPLDEQESAEQQKSHKAKARLVVLGFMDPSINTIQRDSPTLNRHSRMLILQLIASRGWTLRSFDIKAAFLQGQPQEGRMLALEPVPELRAAMKLKGSEICQLTKSAYGLIDAPYLWYKALQKELFNLGFQEAPFDPCVYVYRKADGTPCGVLGLHVDDGLCGGDSEFLQKLEQLEARFSFGSKKVGEFTFTGIDLSQRGDGSIVLSQSKYVNSINPIKIDPQRKYKEDLDVTDDERHKLRGLVGSLQYASVNTRPDLSHRLSQIQSSITKAKICDLLEANRLLHLAKRHHDICLTIKPIPCSEFRFLAFSDASFSSPKMPSSYAGSIVLGTHQAIVDNQACPVSPLSWGSKKIQKVVVSTLAAETMALTSTLDHLSWLRLYWGWLLSDHCQWKTPTASLQNLPPSTTVVAPSQDDIAVVDCKSLYDLVSRTAPPNCSEYRTQLHAKAIKEMMNEGVSLRWVHSGAQLADALTTKAMESSFLRETLRNGYYQLSDENSVLKERSHKKTRLKWLRDIASRSEEK